MMYDATESFDSTLNYLFCIKNTVIVRYSRTTLFYNFLH